MKTLKEKLDQICWNRFKTHYQYLELDNSKVVVLTDLINDVEQEILALQQENEKLRSQIRDTKLRQCPNCNSVDDVIMFTSDLDICNRCNKTF